METGKAPQPIKKGPLVERALRKVLSPERAVEFQAANIMMGLEIWHDMTLYPEKYGLRPDQAGGGPSSLPTDPVIRWAVDNIGDIWEISAGHSALRLGFVAVNEVLKKTTGKEIPDDACFWASLTTTVTIKAIHSLGYISLFGIHDHMDKPVPEMLFGQAVAAVVLAASHYATKYREPIKNLALRAARFTGRKFKEFDTTIDNLAMSDVTPNIAVSTSNEKDEKEVP